VGADFEPMGQPMSMAASRGLRLSWLCANKEDSQWDHCVCFSCRIIIM